MSFSTASTPATWAANSTFGPLSTTAIESAEVYRGPDSNLFGADAESGVVSLTTPHGTTSFPSLLFEGDAGSSIHRANSLRLPARTSGLTTSATSVGCKLPTTCPTTSSMWQLAAANVGWALNGTTQIRGTAHYGVSATGVPNAWDFYHVADDATEKDQDIFVSASIDNQTTASLHNSVRYGLIRKREQ
jgi:vitamin B12 transporter